MKREDGASGSNAVGFAKNHFTDLLLLLLVVVYIVVFTRLALLQHDSFRTGLDLALFDQYVWNMAAGHFLRNTIVEASALWNFYFAPLLAVFVPFYALWSDARTLLVLQTLALAGAVLPIYWYARSQLGRALALAVAFSFLLYPALEYVNLSQFHAISLTIPLLSLAAYFLLTKRDTPMLVCAALLILVKEEVLFVVSGLGLYAVIAQRRHRFGLLILLSTSIWLLVFMNYLFPWLTGRSYFFARGHLFDQLGANVPEIARTMINQPGQALDTLASPHNLMFLSYLLFPLAFVPLIGADVLLLVMPALVMTFLTRTAWIESHYPSLLIPGIHFAAIAGLRRLLAADFAKLHIHLDIGRHARKRVLCGLIVGSSVCGYVLIGPFPFADRFDPSRFDGLGVQAATYQRIIDLVPRDATVVAQEEVLPHFSSREYVYSFPAIPDYRQTDYLVARRGRLFYNFHKGVLDSWMSTGYFETVVDKDGLMLAGRKMPETSPNIRFGDSMILLGYTLFPPTPWKGGTVSRPIVTWQATKRITEKYSIAIQVVDQQGHVWSRTIGEPHNGVTPTTQWKVGKPVGDQYQLNLPPTMPTGDYQIALEVHNSDGAYLEAFDSEGTLIGTGLVLSTVRIEKDKSSVTASQLEMGHRLYVDIQEMRLLGFELDRRQFKVRDTLELGLYWRARAKPQEDYVVKTQLCDSAGRVVFEETSRPAQGAYPTTEWNAGEVLLDWHDWRIPDSLSDGAYTLKVSLIQTPNGTILGEAELADITITGTDGVP